MANKDVCINKRETYHRYLCSICGNPIVECPHIRGAMYDGEQCDIEVEEISSDDYEGKKVGKDSYTGMGSNSDDTTSFKKKSVKEATEL